MNPSEPASTEWVVIRPVGHIADSDLASVFEGEWRERGDLDDEDAITLDGPRGPVRARPTDEYETSPDGRRAQIYRVPSHDDEGTEPYRG